MGRFIVLKVRGWEEKHQAWIQAEAVGAVAKEGNLIRVVLQGNLAYVALDKEGSAFSRIASALTDRAQEGATVEVLVDDLMTERGR